MATKHEIEIPDLPEGWKAVAYRIPEKDENYLSIDGLVEKHDFRIYSPRIIVEKIKPRRIVLEETDELRRVNNGEYYYHNGYALCRPFPSPTDLEFKIWRVVEEE